MINAHAKPGPSGSGSKGCLAFGVERTMGDHMAARERMW